MTPKANVQLWPGMTQGQLDGWAEYLRVLADGFGLRDWSFCMMPTPAPSDAGAAIRILYGRRFGDIQVGAEFNTFPPEVQRHYLLHELAHCHLDQVEVPVRQGQAVWRILGDSAGDVLRCQVHLAIEQAVDAIAEAIADHYPLPSG